MTNNKEYFMLRKGILAAVFASLAVGAFAQKEQVMLDKVVAVVGASSILRSDVQQYAQQLTAERLQKGYTSDRDPMNEALEALLTQELLYNQGQIDSVKIQDDQVASQAEDHLQYLISQAGSIPKLEAQYHMAVFNIRETLRHHYEEQAYAQAEQQSVTEKVTVIPGEVEQYYKAIDKDSLPVIADQYVYAQITRFPKSMKEAKERTRQRLLEMRERVISGSAKFDNLARMYSQDGTAMRGGEMDPTPLEGLDPAFAVALEDMKPGQISEVVESTFGFHIIQLIDKRGNLYHFRHILLKPDYTDAELAEGAHFLDSLAQKIRADSITFEAAALKYSDDAGSKMNGGIVSNTDVAKDYAMQAGLTDAKQTVTKFLREDFAAFRTLDDYNALLKLKVGEISDSYLTEDILGNKLAKIVKLVEIIPTHVAALDTDYLRVEQLALAAKQDKAFKAWMREKIEGMYVWIDPSMRDGDFQYKEWVK